MSKRFGLMGLATVESEYLGGGAKLTCSDRTAADVDTEIMELLKTCYEEAKEMLSGNRELMDKLAAHLIEKETISGKEFMKIYRQEKGIPEPEETDQEEPAKKPEEPAIENVSEPLPSEPEPEPLSEKPEEKEDTVDEDDDRPRGLFSGTRPD